MSITIDYITSANLIALNLEVIDQWAAIETFADLLETDGTAMEMGIAIPHAKSRGVSTLSKEEG